VDKPGGTLIGLAIPYTHYPWVYVCKIALTLAAVAFVWPGYRVFPLRVSPTAILVGAVGGPLWIDLCLLDCEHRFLLPLLDPMGLGWLVGSGVRSGFNPFDPANGLSPLAAWAFLSVRFLGLVAVVSLIEEFFLRGFVMRFVMERDWWNVPFGKASGLALVLGTALPILSHPEWLAAAVWFSMITWLMLRTRNIWDCVAAHAITNLILGVYVVVSGDWRWM
jgi:membrane protease YdiL (CAAX protease family)